MNQKLHILFLCGWYPSRVLPTNGDFIQRHAEAVSLQHCVSTLHIITNNNIKKTEYHFFEKNNVKTFIAYVRPSSNLVTKYRLFYKAYSHMLKQIEPFDIVHLNTLFPFGVFALHQKWFKQKPYIISEHWTGYLKPQSKNIGVFQSIISKVIVKNASFVCPVSQNLAKNMQESGLKGNYYPIPNVVNTDIFYPKKNKNKKFNILHISNMKDDQKNISELLKALSILQKKIEEFSITFVGESSKKYSKLSEKLNITDILFVDQVQQEKLNTYFNSADVFVLFSNTENLPCVILEAFATGTPVISTNIGGISEYFPDNFGVLIEKGSKIQLINELVKIYYNEYKFSNTKKMHEYAVSNFSKEKICEDFTKLYFKALKK